MANKATKSPGASPLAHSMASVACAALVSLSATVAAAQGIPEGLAPLPDAPEINQARADLGKFLFFDSRMSGDSGNSCSTCHDPAKGWGDGEALSTGYTGDEYFRNAPGLFNIADRNFFMWDRRLDGADLGTVVRDMLVESHTMNIDSRLAQERLKQVPEYAAMFEATSVARQVNGTFTDRRHRPPFRVHPEKRGDITVDDAPIAHLCFSTRPGLKEARACRLVIMPEWQGAGLGLRFLNEVCALWRRGENRYGIPMPTLSHTSHPGLAASLRRSDLWAQVSCELFGGSKLRSAASIERSSRTGTWAKPTGGKSGYGGHMRAVQGFRYVE